MKLLNCGLSFLRFGLVLVEKLSKLNRFLYKKHLNIEIDFLKSWEKRAREEINEIEEELWAIKNPEKFQGLVSWMGMIDDIYYEISPEDESKIIEEISKI